MATFGSTIGSRPTARALQIEGVRNVFSLAGDHTLPVLGAVGALEFRIAGQPCVVMYTSAGFANAIPGLAGAFHPGSSSPFISGCADQTVQRRR